jgi:hypothetical protein
MMVSCWVPWPELRGIHAGVISGGDSAETGEKRVARDQMCDVLVKKRQAVRQSVEGDGTQQALEGSRDGPSLHELLLVDANH